MNGKSFPALSVSKSASTTKIMKIAQWKKCFFIEKYNENIQKSSLALFRCVKLNYKNLWLKNLLRIFFRRSFAMSNRVKNTWIFKKGKIYTYRSIERMEFHFNVNWWNLLFFCRGIKRRETWTEIGDDSEKKRFNVRNISKSFLFMSPIDGKTFTTLHQCHSNPNSWVRSKCFHSKSCNMRQAFD